MSYSELATPILFFIKYVATYVCIFNVCLCVYRKSDEMDTPIYSDKVNNSQTE